MADYQGQVAVITGAASGIGRGIANRCAEQGMKLALADINDENLTAFVKDLQTRRVEVISSVVDVTNDKQVEAFAQKTFNHYGVVNLFFNNAGVTTVGNVWSMSMKDWRWVFDVNFFGLVHGIKGFVPKMIKQDIDCSIVNTASVAGLLISANSPAYGCSKHAAVALTEFLNLHLQTEKAKVKAFVFCPGYVATDLYKSNQLRPIDPDEPYYQTQDYLSRTKLMEGNVKAGIPVEAAIDILFKALKEDTFYIITHPQHIPVIDARNDNILAGKRPLIV